MPIAGAMAARENATVQYAGASPLNFSDVFQINLILLADLPVSATYLTVQAGMGSKLHHDTVSCDSVGASSSEGRATFRDG